MENTLRVFIPNEKISPRNSFSCAPHANSEFSLMLNGTHQPLFPDGAHLCGSYCFRNKGVKSKCVSLFISHNVLKLWFPSVSKFT